MRVPFHIHSSADSSFCPLRSPTDPNAMSCQMRCRRSPPRRGDRTGLRRARRRIVRNTFYRSTARRAALQAPSRTAMSLALMRSGCTACNASTLRLKLGFPAAFSLASASFVTTSPARYSLAVTNPEYLSPSVTFAGSRKTALSSSEMQYPLCRAHSSRSALPRSSLWSLSGQCTDAPCAS